MTRRKIINVLIKDQLERFSSTYHSLYEEGKGPMMQLHELGLAVPSEFKIAAEYTLSGKFNDIILNAEDLGDYDILQEAFDITKEAKKLGVSLDCKLAENVYSSYITRKMKKLDDNMEINTLGKDNKLIISFKRARTQAKLNGSSKFIL
ncbi:MAG: hypothetical protein MZV64_27270 [Ignavibacteriales bacterium]|nr:hypothetical protein [Ignavibacteriales bacterium]